MNSRRMNTAVDVSANRWLLQRYAYLEERLLATQAGWIWDSAPMEHKIELARLAYEDASHADALRGRADELFPPTVSPPRQLELAALASWCNEVANAPVPAERFVGLFRVAKTALLRAYQEHLARTDELVDWRTSDILRRIVADEQEHLAWGERGLAAMLSVQGTADRARDWERHLGAALAAIGGIGEDGPRGAEPAYRDGRPPARGAYTFPARDERYHVVPIAEFQTPRPDDRPNALVRLALYTNANGELEAQEIIGRVLGYALDLPWGMRLDLARQMWDEARHAEMSWRRMEDLGGKPDPAPSVSFLWPLYAGENTDALEDLVVLQRAAEGRATEAHRNRVAFIGKELGDETTARLYEYIVADERAHIGYSSWVHRLVADDPARIEHLNRVQARAEAAITEYFRRRADATARARAAGRSA